MSLFYVWCILLTFKCKVYGAGEAVTLPGSVQPPAAPGMPDQTNLDR